MPSIGSKTEDLSPVEEKTEPAPALASTAAQNKPEVGGVPVSKQEEEESDDDDIL